MILIFAVFLGKAQDTIFKRDTEKIICIVKEVGDEIKYKSFDNPDGPAYVIAKSQVKSISYKNGLKEEFSETPVIERNTDEAIQERKKTVESLKTASREKLLSIYTNIPKNLLAEYNIGVEFGINKHFAVGIGLGQVHKNDAFDPLPLSPSQNRWPGTVYEGYAFRLNAKIYPFTKISDYWNFQILYKIVSYTDHEFTDKVYDGNHYDNFVTYKRTEQNNVSGFSITHGHEYGTANGYLYIDFFYGMGIRYRERRINTTEIKAIYYTNESPPLGYTEQFQTFPVIETGFKIGFNFLKKNELTRDQKNQ